MSVTTYLSTSCQIQSICIWYHEQHWIVKRSSVVCHMSLGGYIISFTQVKLTFPYIFLLVDFSLYFPISWLFQMGSHWSHWTAKSSLCPLAVLMRGGVYHKFYPGKTDFSLYFPISWPFLIFSYYLTVSNGLSWCLNEQQRVHSVL